VVDFLNVFVLFHHVEHFLEVLANLRVFNLIACDGNGAYTRVDKFIAL